MKLLVGGEQVRVPGTTEHPLDARQPQAPTLVIGSEGVLIVLPVGWPWPWPRGGCDIKVGTYIPRRTGYHSTGNTRPDARTHLSTYLVLSILLIPDHSCDLLLHTSLLIAVVDDRVYTPRLTAWGFFGVWTSPTSVTTHHNSLTAGR
jgi:hypothetical protein